MDERLSGIDPTLGLVMRAFESCAPIFQALGDPHRQSIVLLLAQHDRLAVNVIAEAMPLSRPAVSHHLKVLKSAGLLRLTRESRENYYSLDIDPALDQLDALVRAARSSCA
jgi:DNA-binding transcriptional ArsR family regulator